MCHHELYELVGLRSTPTCVGNVPPRAVRTCRPAVHPHVRGECATTSCTNLSACGSPPRAWGMCHHELYELVGLRFTPTCVGNVQTAGPSPGRCPVHPHVRGECATTSCTNLSACGSPPRAWGMSPGSAPLATHQRFTPHVRGECWAARVAALAVFGSPPRAWGMSPLPPPLRDRFRFTPTCVGNVGASRCRCAG